MDRKRHPHKTFGDALVLDSFLLSFLMGIYEVDYNRLD